MVLSCRFYANRYPEVEDVVMVNVRSIAEMGAYVHLLEYNNIEGMILLSELSRRRIRSINKLIRVSRNEVVVVIRVDKDKGRTRPGVIKLFPCSTQLSTKFILLINVKMPTIVGILTFMSRINATSKGLRARKVFIFQHFSFYEHLKFHAQLS